MKSGDMNVVKGGRKKEFN